MKVEITKKENENRNHETGKWNRNDEHRKRKPKTLKRKTKM